MFGAYHNRILVKYLFRLWLRLRYRLGGRPYRRLVLERIGGIPLIVLPDVFNPALFRTGAFLAQTLQQNPRSSPGGLQRALRGWAGREETVTVLDMGTGSGVGAVFAARLGARVVAVDVNPEAVRCARLNALLNRLEDRIEVRQGDLFAPVANAQFDLVLFNPPFYRGRPRDDLDRAWRSEDVPERFAAGLGAHLKPEGRALVVLSTDGEWPAVLAALEANGFSAAPLARRNFGNEIITVYSVTHSHSIPFEV
ncbi:MAG: methyltransferase [Chloroflexota bacterium]